MRITLLKIAVFIFILLLSSTALAGMIGNPNATIGERTFALETKLEASSRDIEYNLWGKREYASSRLILEGIYGSTDRINVFGKLGIADIYDRREDDFKFEGDYGFAYGAGLKATVYEIPKSNFKFGVTAQFLNFTSEDSEIIREINCIEYNLAAGVSYEIGEVTRSLPSGWRRREKQKLHFSLYGGVFLSKLNGESEESYPAGATPSTTVDFEESDLFGVFVGGDILLLNHLKIGGEVHLINETAYLLSLSYVF